LFAFFLSAALKREPFSKPEDGRIPLPDQPLLRIVGKTAAAARAADLPPENGGPGVRFSSADNTLTFPLDICLLIKYTCTYRYGWKQTKINVRVWWAKK
jgi:hypothetical protein